MMIIGFYNFKGGVGTTTLAAHTCLLGQELGLQVAGVSADFKRGLWRWPEGTQIPCLEIDLRDGQSDADLIVLDVQSHSEPPIVPDVWVLPICDRTSAENACDISDRLRGHLIWLGNKGREVVVPEYLVDDVTVALPLPYSRALKQATAQRRPVWSIPELAQSSGAKAVRASLMDVLTRAFALVGKPLQIDASQAPRADHTIESMH